MTAPDSNYDAAVGPVVEGSRGQRTPADLTRSRRHGLSRLVCEACGSTRHAAGAMRTLHRHDCPTPNAWRRERTTPCPNNDMCGEFA